MKFKGSIDLILFALLLNYGNSMEKNGYQFELCLIECAWQFAHFAPFTLNNGQVVPVMQENRSEFQLCQMGCAFPSIDLSPSEQTQQGRRFFEESVINAGKLALVESKIDSVDILCGQVTAEEQCTVMLSIILNGSSQLSSSIEQLFIVDVFTNNDTEPMRRVHSFSTELSISELPCDHSSYRFQVSSIDYLKGQLSRPFMSTGFEDFNGHGYGSPIQLSILNMSLSNNTPSTVSVLVNWYRENNKKGLLPCSYYLNITSANTEMSNRNVVTLDSSHVFLLNGLQFSTDHLLRLTPIIDTANMDHNQPVELRFTTLSCRALRDGQLCASETATKLNGSRSETRTITVEPMGFGPTNGVLNGSNDFSSLAVIAVSLLLLFLSLMLVVLFIRPCHPGQPKGNHKNKTGGVSEELETTLVQLKQPALTPLLPDKHRNVIGYNQPVVNSGCVLRLPNRNGTFSLAQWKMGTLDLMCQISAARSLCTGNGHPNIVRLVGVTVSDLGIPNGTLYEWFYGPRLDQYLLNMEKEYAKSKNANREVEWFRLVFFTYQLCTAIAYLHDRSIVHRQITTRHVLLQLDDQHRPHNVKLSGFDLCCELVNLKATVSDSVVDNRPPELNHSRQYSTAGDIWQCGCVMGAMIGVGDTFLKVGLKRGNFGDILYQAYVKCIRNDPRQRPDSQELCRFFSQVQQVNQR